MQDWPFFLTPMAAFAYFLAEPSEFTAYMDWFARHFRDQLFRPRRLG